MPLRLMTPITRLLAFSGIAIVHVAVGVLLYRLRARPGWDAGDVVVFLVPFVLAMAAYLSALRARSKRGDSSLLHLRSISLALSLLFAFISFSIAMLVALNLYGS